MGLPDMGRIIVHVSLQRRKFLGHHNYIGRNSMYLSWLPMLFGFRHGYQIRIYFQVSHKVILEKIGIFNVIEVSRAIPLSECQWGHGYWKSRSNIASYALNSTRNPSRRKAT